MGRNARTKKSKWSKIDLNDVETKLDQKRTEEELAGGVSDLPDSQLFVIDSTGNIDSRSSKRKRSQSRAKGDDGDKKPAGAAVKKKTAKKKATRVQQASVEEVVTDAPEQTQEAPEQTEEAPGSRRQSRSRIHKQKHKRKVKQGKLQGAVKEQSLQETRPAFKPEVKPKASYAAGVVDEELYDVWGATASTAPPRAAKRKRTPVELMGAGQKMGLKVAHPGASYNPGQEEHKELLSQAALIEERQRQEELDMQLMLRGQHPKLKPKLLTAEEIEQAEREDTPADPKKPIRAEERLSRTERNRQKRLKAEEQELAARRAEKQQTLDMRSLKKIKRELKQEEKEQEVKKELKKKLIEDSTTDPLQLPAGQTPVLSKHSRLKAKEAFPDIALPEDISGQMRDLPVTGSVVRDQFLRFEKKGLIEPRLRVNKRKSTRSKEYTKKSHRDPVQPM